MPECDHCIPEKYDGVSGLCRVIEHEEMGYALKMFWENGVTTGVPISHCPWCGHEFEDKDFLRTVFTPEELGYKFNSPVFRRVSDA